jgi:hypothetical protein
MAGEEVERSPLKIVKWKNPAKKRIQINGPKF